MRLFIAVNFSEEIRNKILEVQNQLRDAGFTADTKLFKAYITIAREIKSYTMPIIINCPDIIIRAERMSLMKSERIKGVLKYTDIT